MLNHFFFKKLNNGYLLTNDFGKYAVLSDSDFSLLAENRIDESHPKYKELYDGFFVYNERKEVFINRVCDFMRDSKAHLFQSTSLFIFVLTDICNAACVYCQAQDSSSKCLGKMTKETAKKAVEIALNSPSYNLTFEFQGGEPLLNFETIRFIVEYSKELNTPKHKNIEYSLVSNLVLLTDEIAKFFKENKISVSTSLDGNTDIHNHNRPLKDGTHTFDTVVSGINRLREAEVSVGAIETTTRYTLDKYKEMIDAYIQLDLNSIFIRHLTPLGIARENWDSIGYSADEFVNFYANCIKYLIGLNKNGTFISEGHAGIFLKKILSGNNVNYMELRSPCGAGIGQMAFYYDGKVFTCDEGRMVAEMGDDSFCLGTVNSSYDSLIANPVCKATCAASVLESLSDCSDCVYSPYCGTCPVINYSMAGDIFAREANGYRCKVYKGMLDTIFNILTSDDKEAIDILRSWTGIKADTGNLLCNK